MAAHACETCFAGYRGRLVGEGEIKERSGVFRGIWAGGVSSIFVYECRSNNLFMECKRQGVDCPCATCSRRRACDRHSDVTMLSHGELCIRPINAVAVHCATWRQTPSSACEDVYGRISAFTRFAKRLCPFTCDMRRPWVDDLLCMRPGTRHARTTHVFTQGSRSQPRDCIVYFLVKHRLSNKNNVSSFRHLTIVVRFT